MQATLQDVLQAGFGSFSAGRRLRAAVHRMARSVMACRTSRLGGHVKLCPVGHIEGIWYNSCKHRACPQCAGIQIERWIERQRARLLGCDHFHVVFTIPHELHLLWRWNRSWLNDQLFRCSRDTLMELLQDGKYLGATPGMLLSLHTWGRSLALHPHIHCLVTGGGWDGQQWCSVRNGYLVPVRVAQALFRGKLLAALRAALHSEDLVLPPEMGRSPALNLFNKLGRKRWNVHLRTRYAHGRGVLTYLARYVRGGPLSDRRIVSADDDTVRFRYTDHRDGKTKVMPLARDEFLSRIFEHVPEPGVHSVRSYGLYSASNRALLDECRLLLGQAPAESPEYLTAEAYLERVGRADRIRCSVCGRRLHQVPLLVASGLPPPPQERYRHVA